MPLSTRRLARDLFSKNKDKLENLNWICFIQPVANCALYYGLLRNVSTKQEYFYYITDVFLSLQKTTLLSNIHPPLTRGTVLFDFVNAILNGKYPSQALKTATKDIKLDESIKFPIDKFVIDSKGKLSRKLDKKFEKKQQIKSNNFIRNIDSNKKKQPIKVPCRNCNMLVFSNTFTAHNRVCPRVRQF